MSCLLFLLLLAQPGPGNQQVHGLAELAAGLGCWENLDSACAVDYLRQALEKLDPQRDPNYLEHVTRARWTLAQIHLAADDLAGAERQLDLLLSLNPDFTLPPGDHPPKMIYVYEQAREQMLLRKKTASRPKLTAATPPSSPAAAPAPAPAVSQSPSPIPASPDNAPAVASSARRRWFFEAQGKADFVFGGDSRTMYPAGGAELTLGWRAVPELAGGLSAGWSHHRLRGGETALQQFRLGLAADFYRPGKDLELALRVAVAAVALGTRDRYDHFGVLLDFGAGLVWLFSEKLAAVLWLLPEAVILENGVSFRLGLSLGLRLPW